jgi:germination protein M
MTLGDDIDTEGKGPRRRRMAYWGVALALFAVVAWLLLRSRAGLPPEQPPDASGSPAAASAKSVTLYFADNEAKSLVTEKRDIPFGDSLEENVEATLAALIGGPTQSGVAVLPGETRLEQTYWSEENQTLYLDFNAALVAKHPGGSAAEYSTISALVRTIAANFPMVKRVQILVDGQPVETLAGHFDTSKPIEIATWQ